MKVGVFGGTFNPIHYGHLRAAEEVRERFDLAKIIFIPAKDPPLKIQELPAPEHRYKMTELALSDNSFFEISDIEYKRPGKSYSVQTVEELQDRYHGSTLYFILGIDAFLELPHWWHPERLISLIDFIIISRPFFKFVDLLSSPYIDADRGSLERLDRGEFEPYTAKLKSDRDVIALRVSLMDISATEIRRMVREGKSIRYLLPEAIESYIITNRLYRRNE
jgi:nicotinate-nucleotide adenylyltransferase